jgi:hypothetical protein
MGCLRNRPWFETIVKQTIDGQKQKITWDACPRRNSATGGYRNWQDIVVPLFVGRKPASE